MEYQYSPIPTPAWAKSATATVAKRWYSCNLRKILSLALAAVALSFVTLSYHQHGPSVSAVLNSVGIGSVDSPFSGAFARFPRISDLSAKHRRMTVITVWNNDAAPSYLRHFFYSAQRNADTLDFLFINRAFPGRNCLDLDAAGIDATWGGNLKVVCLQDDEFIRRYVDFLCSTQGGWGCTERERAQVTLSFGSRDNLKNVNWRPLQGYIFHEFFAHPENPFWAFTDIDAFMGDFRRYPFNVLSQLSMVTGDSMQSDSLFLRGQLTAFNMEDDALRTGWKKLPRLENPVRFTSYMVDKDRTLCPEATIAKPDWCGDLVDEEGYWSRGYLRSDGKGPGRDLSWCIYPHYHGDDFFDGRWNVENATQVTLISGRDIFQVPLSLSREETENLVIQERNTPVDDLGSIGWTPGEDYSEQLMNAKTTQAANNATRMLQLAQSQPPDPDHPVFTGILQEIQPLKKCPNPQTFRHTCVAMHPGTEPSPKPPKYDVSMLHFKDQKPNRILRRLEMANQTRTYERKLIRHHLYAKKRPWFQWPPFDITDDLIMRYNLDFIEVYRMGAATRNETLYHRWNGQ